MHNPILRLENITKSFGPKVVLNDLNLDVQKGDYIAIIGESGSGKSTLLNILSTFDFANSGNYYINNRLLTTKDISNCADIRNSFFGFVFQSYCLLSKLSVEENICLPFLYSDSPADDAEIKKRMSYLIDIFNIEKIRNQKIECLSGGEKQRVALARALITKPKVLIADEPTGNLDGDNAKIIFDAFEKMNVEEGLTIILVTHSQQPFSKIVKIYRLKNGKLHKE